MTRDPAPFPLDAAIVDAAILRRRDDLAERCAALTARKAKADALLATASALPASVLAGSSAGPARVERLAALEDEHALRLELSQFAHDAAAAHKRLAESLPNWLTVRESVAATLRANGWAVPEANERNGHAYGLSNGVVNARPKSRASRDRHDELTAKGLPSDYLRENRRAIDGIEAAIETARGRLLATA